VLWVGLYGRVEMTLCLTEEKILYFCRLFLWLLIWSMCDHTFFRRRNKHILMLDAAVQRRLHGLSINMLAGGSLGEFVMHRCLVFLVFCWFLVTIF
jgi:hypothetical protein